jgi:hypothetical protein
MRGNNKRRPISESRNEARAQQVERADGELSTMTMLTGGAFLADRSRRWCIFSGRRYHRRRTHPGQDLPPGFGQRPAEFAAIRRASFI